MSFRLRTQDGFSSPALVLLSPSGLGGGGGGAMIIAGGEWPLEEESPVSLSIVCYRPHAKRDVGTDVVCVKRGEDNYYGRLSNEIESERKKQGKKTTEKRSLLRTLDALQISNINRVASHTWWAIDFSRFCYRHRSETVRWRSDAKTRLRTVVRYLSFASAYQKGTISDNAAAATDTS